MKIKLSTFFSKMNTDFSYIKFNGYNTNECDIDYEYKTLNKYNEDGVLRNGKYDMGDFVAYFKDGVFHRDDDLPAVIYKNGQKEWWINGKLERRNANPVVIFENKSELWFSTLSEDDDYHHNTYFYYNDAGKGDYSNSKKVMTHLGFFMPEEMYSNKTQYFYREKLLHRDPEYGVDMPAVIMRMEM
jgi:hypothetical protein